VVNIQLVLVVMAALISLAFGVRYFTSGAYMPYHAVVAGKSWPEVDAGMQAVILGLFKIAAAGFCTYGAGLLWLLVPLRERAAWASWAVLTLTLIEVAPSLYVTLALRRTAPSAPTPVIPAAMVLALGIAGAVLGLFARLQELRT
jgi:hypothetical protein